MIEALQRLYDALLAWFNASWDWLNNGLYDFAQWAFAQYVEWYSIQLLKFKIAAVVFAWGAAKKILADLDLSAKLDLAFGLLPGPALNVLEALDIPQCLMLILTAVVTKFVLRFIPGMT
ncbi:MAG: DUF2523 family protein [Methylococcus sp.]|nr:DUF2523 family protein [Methylococcus sp.]